MKREEIKDEKRNKILDVSFDLFIQKGIRETSIQDIVDKAGLGKGTFYFYFKDKYQVKSILVKQKSHALFSNALQKLHLQENMKKLTDKVIFVTNEIIDQLTSQPELLKFISKDLSYALYKSAIDEIYQINEKTITEIFCNSVKENGEKLKHPRILLSIIVELVSSTCYNSILYNEPVNIKEFKPFLFDNMRVLIENPNN